jgi:hypothetical protein
MNVLATMPLHGSISPWGAFFIIAVTVYSVLAFVYAMKINRK